MTEDALFEGPGATDRSLGRLPFLVPPSSVLNARGGYWQERKRAWLSLGIKSELGREGNLTITSHAASFDYYRVKEGTRASTTEQGTSIFDPVLCELAYRWWAPPGGLVLDPFAGGSVRGVVAAHLGHPYYGVDLRPEQIAANRDQGDALCGGCAFMPRWLPGDSRHLAFMSDVPRADFVFSCPPYGDLEVYSTDPADLSNMPPHEFSQAYRDVIYAAAGKLKPHRFACFVVGDYRDSKGFYRNFVGATVDAFAAAGLRLYDEAVLVTAVGSLSMRIKKQFTSGRKLGKTHQNVLVFVKGDPAQAVAALTGQKEQGDDAT